VLCCWQGDAAAALAHYQQAARFLSWTSFKLRDEGGDVDMSPEEQVVRQWAWLCSAGGNHHEWHTGRLPLPDCFVSSCLQQRVSITCSSQSGKQLQSVAYCMQKPCEACE
jgi:hypothetical protein